MVSAPVGHLAAAVLVPPAELVVAVGLAVLEAERHLRGGAEPEVPVEALGHLRLGDGTAGRVVADAALDLLDGADAASANDLTGQPEHASHLGPLLAASLHHSSGF